MSNQLDITVGIFTPLNATAPCTEIMVVAGDSYVNDLRTYASIEAFMEENPTEEELIVNVLNWAAFEGGADFKADGSYELEGISYVDVVGYPK